MSAVNPLPGSGPMQFKPPASEQRAYEPSMEEILASIRRIIADDQSLPNRASPGEDAPAPDGHGAAGGEHPAQAPPGGQTQGIAQGLQTPGFQPPPVDPTSYFDRVSPAHPAPQPAAEPAPSTDAFDGAPASVTMLHQVLQGRREASGADHAPSAVATEPYPDGRDMIEHGHIAAPQFASPAGPAPHRRDDGHGAETASESAIDGDALSEGDASALFSSETDRTVTGAFNALAATRLADNSADLLGIAREMIRPLLKDWLDDNLPAMVERMVRAEIERVARGGR